MKRFSSSFCFSALTLLFQADWCLNQEEARA
ncbi:hypothetical protein NC651_008433 [Populus alba x Populus x berolinensis]|nr:hypothetical protein NC651_008433 [Populus alba x Populus x berolinensis]